MLISVLEINNFLQNKDEISLLKEKKNIKQIVRYGNRNYLSVC